MQNKIKNITHYKWMKRIVFPILLVGLWFLLTAWYITVAQSILVLSYPHPKESFTNFTSAKLLKGDSITGEFIAQEENLGIVAIRFQKFERIPYTHEDMLLFQFKEKGHKDWYYQNYYRSGFIYDLPFLPFGFPIISHSKGKVYNFKLTSLKGNKENGVALSPRQPILVSEYQEDKSILLKDPKEFLAFGVKKFINAFQTVDVLYSAIVFSLPFFSYLFWISPTKDYFVNFLLSYLRKHINKDDKKIFGEYYVALLTFPEKVIEYNLIFLLLIIILIDVSFLQVLNDLLYIVIMTLWVVLMRAYMLESKWSFLSALFLLAFSPVFLQLDIITIAEKASAWAFILLVTGILQALLERNDTRKSNK
jgi:hypothetical protein